MILEAVIDEQVYTLNVPEPVLERGAEFFDQLDRDMDSGWQMSREWVDAPNRLQRCQIVADKLLTALEKENDKLGMLMAGYILSRLPNVARVELDLQGEVQNNLFHFHEHAHDQAASAATTGDADTAPSAATPSTALDNGAPRELTKIQAMAQAGHDVTQVFKVGKAYRFSVYDHATETWQDSPLIATEAEAERLRQQAFNDRYQELQRA